MQRIKKLILLIGITVTLSALNVYGLSAQTLKSKNHSVNFGGGFAKRGGDNGFAVFNEFRFDIWKHFYAGPNFYFSRTGYFLDNKNAITHLYGVDLNVFYALIDKPSFSLMLGPGYTLKHIDYSFVYPVFFDQQTFGRSENKNSSIGIVNLLMEKSIAGKYKLGLKGSWHPDGTNESFFYTGLYFGLKL